MSGLDSGQVAADSGTSNEADAGDDQPDAGQADAGERDAGPLDAGADAVTLSLVSDDQSVHLFWDPGALRARGWVVFRQGQQLAMLGASARDFEDLTAAAGNLAGLDASATQAVPDGIELEWTTPSSVAGPESVYRVQALLGSAVPVDSNEVRGQRGPPKLLGFTVERGDGGWSFTAIQTSWLDVGAPLPSVSLSALRAEAEVSDKTSSVVLRAVTTVSREVMNVDYTVRARASAGIEPEARVSGYRGGNRVEFQWQRSTDDSPDAFVDLQYVHGQLWLDPDAVLGEGRFYRVAARSRSAQWISPPVRAELHRPLFVAGDHFNRYLLRDDGLAVPLAGYPPLPATQFPPVLEFVVAEGIPCALLYDAGVVCAQRDAGLVSMSLPPATHLIGGGALCVSTTDAGASCLPAGRFDLANVERVLEVTGQLLCGRRFDGSVQCRGTTLAPALFDIPGDPQSLWIGLYNSNGVTASYADGRLIAHGGLGTLPPAEDAGYVSGASMQWANCGLRADGRVRCTDPVYGWSYSPPFSLATFATVDIGGNGLCGLTTDGRVRCHVSGTPFVPPTPPVRQIAIEHSESVTLLENGLLDIRGGQTRALLRESPADRFAGISTGSWYITQCGLRADGIATCNGVTPPDRFRQIARGYGLLFDGGIFSWGSPWGTQGPFDELQQSAGGACARFVDGGWACESSNPIPPLQFSMIALGRGQACGLTTGGRLVCWPAPAPGWMSAYRFRHVSYAGETCATTLEGEVFCISYSSTPPLPWDDFLEFQGGIVLGCGVRRDRTRGCRRTNVADQPPW